MREPVLHIEIGGSTATTIAYARTPHSWLLICQLGKSVYLVEQMHDGPLSCCLGPASIDDALDEIQSMTRQGDAAWPPSI